jgi:hypothetical protein
MLALVVVVCGRAGFAQFLLDVASGFLNLPLGPLVIKLGMVLVFRVVLGNSNMGLGAHRFLLGFVLV